MENVREGALLGVGELPVGRDSVEHAQERR